jgi:ureidoacrylate peracid hydrolase
MQNGYCTPGGSYEKYGGNIGADLDAYRHIIPNISRLVTTFRELEIPIFYTQQVREESGIDLFTRLHRIIPERRAEFMRIPACVRGPWDAEIINELQPAKGDHIVIKRRDSAFQDTELDLWLRSTYVDTVICTGVDTAICVENTLTDAFNTGYEDRPAHRVTALLQVWRRSLQVLSGLAMIDQGSGYWLKSSHGH